MQEGVRKRMSKGEFAQKMWTVLRRTQWRRTLHFTLVLLMFMLVSGAHFLRIGELLVCVLCTFGFLFLCDFYKEHVGPVMLRIVKADFLVPFALGFGLSLGYVGKRVGLDLSLPQFVSQAIDFMLMSTPPTGMALLLIARGGAIRKSELKS